MSYKREMKGVCREMDGDWTEDVDGNDGVHRCDLGNTELVHFNPEETDDFDEPEEVVIREKDPANEFKVAPWEIHTKGSRVVVDGITGRYYDGMTSHRVQNGTITIWDSGRMELTEEVTY